MTSPTGEPDRANKDRFSRNLCDVCYESIQSACREIESENSLSSNDDLSSDKKSKWRIVTRPGHGADWQSFQSSVIDGCQLCFRLFESIVYNSVDHSKGTELDLSMLQIDKYSMIAEDSFKHKMWIEFKRNELETVEHTVDYSILSERPSLSDLDRRHCSSLHSSWKLHHRIDETHLSASANSTSNTGDNQALDTAARWMKECMNRHGTPASLELSPTKYPRRLLDVGTDAGSTVRLVDTDSGDVAGPYITLSYCWGGKIEASLRTATLREYLVALPLSRLPQVFQDAVVVSRWLGLRYIWIDALCIVQDNKDDWQQQSSEMAEIYSSSICTIAAQASSNCHQGLFRDRLHAHAQAGVVYDFRPDFEGWYALYYEGAYDSTGNLNESEPLDKRAWTLQEQIFARGLLIFTRNSIRWECNAAEPCIRDETSPVDPNIGAYDLEPTRLGLGYKKSMAKDRESEASDQATGTDHNKRSLHLRKWWRKSLENYSERLLTYPTDRLVAISAVAKRCQAEFKTEYLAGLWLKWLFSDLCWRTKFPGHHQIEYLAPSWSWASVNGPVEFYKSYYMLMNHESSLELATYISHEIIPRGKDPTSQLKDAWLCFEASHLPMSLYMMNQLKNVYDDASQLLEQVSNPLFSPPSLQGSFIGFFIGWDYEHDPAELDRIIDAVPLASSSRTIEAELTGIEGILIETVEKEGSGSGVFRRIGFFEFSGNFLLWRSFCKWSLRHDTHLHQAVPEISNMSRQKMEELLEPRQITLI